MSTLMVSIKDAHLYHVGEEIEVMCDEKDLVKVEVVSVFTEIVEFRLVEGTKRAFLRALSALSVRSFKKHSL